MSLLEGIKVIDAASFIAGPAATTVLADFGADVIKVEPPGTGDPYRNRSSPDNPPSHRCEVEGRQHPTLHLPASYAAGTLVGDYGRLGITAS